MKLFIQISIVFIVFIFIFVSSFYILYKVNNIEVNIQFQDKDLLKSVDYIITYDSYLDSIGFAYQTSKGVYYLGWEINDDNGLCFNFMNKNEFTYYIGYTTLLNTE